VLLCSPYCVEAPGAVVALQDGIKRLPAEVAATLATPLWLPTCLDSVHLHFLHVRFLHGLLMLSLLSMLLCCAGTGAGGDLHPSSSSRAAILAETLVASSSCTSLKACTPFDDDCQVGLAVRTDTRHASIIRLECTLHVPCLAAHACCDNCACGAALLSLARMLIACRRRLPPGKFLHTPRGAPPFQLQHCFIVYLLMFMRAARMCCSVFCTSILRSQQ
jgi:hypothetical protein